MTISWRTKLTFMAGVTLIVTGLMLAFAGPGASGATAPLPVGSPTTEHPTGPPSTPPTSPPSKGHQAPVTSSPTSSTGQNTGTKGDNGTVKIHNPSTAVTDRRNEPHVSCGFYLDAFGFDPGQQITWWITAWAPTGDRATVAIPRQQLTLPTGNGRTDPIELGPGHYKLFWTFTGENGTAKQKVFWVVSTCASDSTTQASAPTESPDPPPSSGDATPPSPHGGLPITGWPLAVLVAGAAALLGTGTAAIVVARRRRSLQSSR